VQIQILLKSGIKAPVLDASDPDEHFRCEYEGEKIRVETVSLYYQNLKRKHTTLGQSKLVCTIPSTHLLILISEMWVFSFKRQSLVRVREKLSTNGKTHQLIGLLVIGRLRGAAGCDKVVPVLT
jgi:hypothetical protein